MATKTFVFPNEGNLYIGFTGEESEKITLTADVNEGLDRELNITFSAEKCEDVVRTVIQEGKREVFTDYDFYLSDGGTFNVIKQKNA